VKAHTEVGSPISVPVGFFANLENELSKKRKEELNDKLVKAGKRPIE
jgi:hypothetical protein